MPGVPPGPSIDVGVLLGQFFQGLEKRLDSIVDDVRTIRENQVESQENIATLRAEGQSRTDMLAEFKDQLDDVKGQVSDLLSFRNKMGGVALACVVLGGLIVKFSGMITGLIAGTAALFKLR